MSRWGVWSRSIRRAVERRVRYKVTRGGWLFILAVIGTGVAAAATADNLLFLIESALLATLLVSGLASRLSLAALELDFLVPEHVPARRKVPGRLFVRNAKFLLPSFSIRVAGVKVEGGAVLTSGVYFPSIPARATLDEPVEAMFPRRGAYRENGFAFSTRFPFGFVEKTARVTLRRETIVYPPIDPREGFEDLLAALAGEMETHFRGLGRDFYRIRPYQTFESARHVDWKASAHVGELQVREFAREQEQTVEMFLDLAVPLGLDEWFERAVECAAFVAWRLAAQDAGVRFRAQGYDVRIPEEGDIYTILKYLALVRPRAGQQPEPPLDETSYQIVFTADPASFVDLGWTSGRVLGPAQLALDQQQ